MPASRRGARPAASISSSFPPRARATGGLRPGSPARRPVAGGPPVPWGLLPQTKFLAEKAIGAVVSAGIKLMTLAFIIAVTSPVLASIHFSGPEIKLNELWSVLLTTGAIAFLTWHAPSLTAGLLAGSPSLSAAGVAQNL